VDRNAFDAMLIAEAAHRGVEVIQPAAATAASRCGTPWTLCIKSREGAAKEIRGRFIVDATGRRSWLASNLGVQHLAYDKLVGIFGFFRSSTGHAPVDSYASIEACEQGWWYSAMLPGNCIAAAFMTDADQLRQLSWRSWDQWPSLLGTAPHLARRIDAAKPLGTPALRPAASQRLQAFAGDGWLAVGDAAGTFDPLSSQGIVRGLRAGVCAARSICRYLRGRSDGLQEYAEFVECEYRKYLDSRAAYYRLEQRWPGSPFWQRRQEEIHLGPEQTVQLLSSHEVDLTRIAAHLPPPEVRSLTALCVSPRKATELVSEFHRRTERRFSDWNVVLTLQQLISQGVLAASARTDHSSQSVPSKPGDPQHARFSRAGVKPGFGLRG
jgi:flavin-dependent dehydrogenase